MQFVVVMFRVTIQLLVLAGKCSVCMGGQVSLCGQQERQGQGLKCWICIEPAIGMHSASARLLVTYI